ncbi:MAG TPA: hypothetical protein VK654_13835 [Nitrospirota bacterium]|nr:hypothetical protein [Nitrospirota bacterium]
MILHPAIIALLLSSGLMSILVVYASWYGFRIVRKWDLGSGSSAQLELERRTYLISTILAYVFGFQLFSLFLYVYTADSLCTLFTGAMCAAGTLNVNGYGYPVLIFKLVNFLLAGFWLIVNYADNRGYDYPLIRFKYFFLIGLAPLLVEETVLQTRYFLGLHANIITSCCGTLFSSTGPSVASDLSSFPAPAMKIAFVCSMSAVITSGIVFMWKGKGSYLLAAASAAALLVSLASLLSFIGPYIYELPTHHCPFCLLQKEYTYVGYPLYFALLSGTVTGMGTGLLTPFRKRSSLAGVVPGLQKKLAAISVFSFALFTLIIMYRLATSNLVM